MEDINLKIVALHEVLTYYCNEENNSYNADILKIAGIIVYGKMRKRYVVYSDNKNKELNLANGICFI